VQPHKQRLIAAVGLAGGAFLFLFRHVIVKLVHDWATDDNYSHGFLIVPIAAYLVWERRGALARHTWQGSNWGAVLLLGGLSLLVAGTLGAELFLTRLAILAVLAGSVLLVGGWDVLSTVKFPLAFLLLMIPIPAIIFNQIAFPLQLLASRFGTAVMSLAAVPVLREGNVLILANTTLEVAEACSGIRSLVSLLTLGVLFSYFGDSRPWMRTILPAATIPIAIFANGARVASAGIAAYYYGPEAAEGALHTFSGWLVFVSSLGLLFVLQKTLLKLFPAAPPAPARWAHGRAA
jgi:exosortase